MEIVSVSRYGALWLWGTDHGIYMRIKGMGKGARSPANPLVCSGRTREMERFEKNQVKQNIRPTEQEIERGSNEQKIRLQWASAGREYKKFIFLVVQYAI